MTYALGIDASTQSVSAIVLDTQEGHIAGRASVNFGIDLPDYHAPQGFIPNGPESEVHADPRMWLDALELCLERLGAECDLRRVEAISGAGQQHGSVYLRRSWREALGTLDPEASLASQIGPSLARQTSPIWMDTSTSTECREIAAKVGGNAVVCANSGSVAIERFTGPQIRRFAKNDSAAYEETARIHLVSSFIASVLAGNDSPIDQGDGAGMNLLNLETGDWDERLLDATAPDLREKLPAVVPSRTLVGPIAPYFVKRFGFSPGVPVVAFTGDNPSSLVGMGASRPGKVVISLGTSDTLFAAMPRPHTDPQGFGHVFGNPQGGFMTLQCFLNGSLAREKVRDRFGLSWEAFSRALEETPPGNKGRQMLPFFGPEISPRTTLKTPVLAGDPPFENWELPEAAVRACVEGQFLNMWIHSRWMKLSTDEIYLTGGASQNDQIARVAADVFGVKVRRLAVGDSVALGGAMRAAVAACGESLEVLESTFCQAETRAIEPRGEARTVYVEARKDFERLLARGVESEDA